jgi:glycosyltransferase involved in cell wall biosynthesis
MKKPRLLIIPGDPLKAYDAKGYSREERNAYYNPHGEFDVSILGFKDEGEKPFEYAGFLVYPLNRSFNGLRDVVNKLNPDLVQGFGKSGAYLSIKIGSEFKLPSIVSVSDLNPSMILNRADKIICVSEAVKDRCLEIGIDEEKLVVIYEGINLDDFQDYSRTEEVEFLNSRYGSKHKILSVGRLVWQKNLENLLLASKIAKKSLPDLTHLHIGGFGDLRDKIDSVVRDLGIDHFHRLPNLSQRKLADFYSWADAFVMASASEGLGLVYVEALACETPVITSNIPPMNQIVTNDFNGLNVDSESPEDIAEKTILLLTNKSLYEKLKSNTRESVRKFDLEEISKKKVEFYKQMLK